MAVAQDDNQFTQWNFSSNLEFERLALDRFREQAHSNEVYGKYLSYLGCVPSKVQAIREIPCLPVELFKSHRVVSGDFEAEMVFTSSGTQGDAPSRHFIHSLGWYKDCFTNIFRKFYGNPSDWCILALLPGYLEREGSSLIYMVKTLIEEGGVKGSGFYLQNYEALINQLDRQVECGQKTMLIGVSYALLDLAEVLQSRYPELIVMETGGMKGRRKEMVRREMHEILMRAFGTNSIHSEYGMTELMSQAYSRGDGRFQSPPWMEVYIRETDDPFAPARDGKTGRINIIDLANVHSCAFIATGDMGRKHPNGEFEVLGRYDHAEVRGCNLLIDA